MASRNSGSSIAGKKSTLSTVARKAGNDPGFFKALVANPKRALKEAGIVLSERDLKKLTRLRMKASGQSLRVKISPAKVQRAFKKIGIAFSDEWPSPNWPMMWSRLVFQGPNGPAEITFKGPQTRPR